jgi:hypothetical protein
MMHAARAYGMLIGNAGVQRTRDPSSELPLPSSTSDGRRTMAMSDWLIHAAFLTALAALIAFTYLGVELDFASFWPISYARG